MAREVEDRSCSERDCRGGIVRSGIQACGEMDADSAYRPLLPLYCTLLSRSRLEQASAFG